MKCRDALRSMAESDRIPPARRRGLERHIDGCSECRRAWNDELMVRAHLAALPMSEPPSDLAARLHAIPHTAAPPSVGHRRLDRAADELTNIPRTGGLRTGPMTLEQWLRTFIVLLALGTLAGITGAPSGSDARLSGSTAPADDHGERSGQPAPTIVARRSETDLTRSRISTASGLEEGSGSRRNTGEDRWSIEAALRNADDHRRPSGADPAAATSVPPSGPLASPVTGTAGSDVPPDASGDAPSPSGATDPSGDRDEDAGHSSNEDPEGQPSTTPTPTVSPGKPTETREAEPAEGGDEPTPQPTALPAPRCFTIPIVAFVDVGGTTSSCAGCDGRLTPEDTKRAAAEGLELPAFHLSVYDSAPETAISYFEEVVRAGGSVYRRAITFCGIAPFTVTIDSVPDGWHGCERGSLRHSITEEPTRPLAMPLYRTCAPLIPPPQPPDPIDRISTPTASPAPQAGRMP